MHAIMDMDEMRQEQNELFIKLSHLVKRIRSHGDVIIIGHDMTIPQLERRIKHYKELLAHIEKHVFLCHKIELKL